MLFIDQPVGTGFSYTTNNNYASNDEQVAEQFYYFLIQFFKLHTNYVSTNNNMKITRNFYLTGESHAGHYIPYISDYILKRNNLITTNSNSNSKTDSILITLKGIALGNPWFDPINQYDVSEFAHGFGLISLEQKYKLLDMNEQCLTGLKSNTFYNKICFDLLDRIVDGSTIQGSHKVLMYDVRKYVIGTNVYPPGKHNVEEYLNRNDVKIALHVTNTPQKFQECTDPPYNALGK